MPSLDKSKYIGVKTTLANGDEIEILEVRSYKDCTVRFLETNNEVVCNLGNIFYDKPMKGVLKNPMKPSVLGVGVVGGLPTKIKGKHTKPYSVWRSMLNRCYSDKVQEDRPNYLEVTVCEDWLYFPNFKKWFDQNYIEGWVLDKDLKVFGSKEYSPTTCSFVPNDINVLLNPNKAIRGSSGICGVYYDKRDEKYYPKCNLGVETYYGQGYYRSEKAWEDYCSVKKKYILSVLKEYSDLHPTVVSNLEKCVVTKDGVEF